MTTNSVLLEVYQERRRQDEKWGEQNHPDGTGEHYRPAAIRAQQDCVFAFEDGEGTYFHILKEEFWEAAAEGDKEKLRAELLQVAAVAVAWVEKIDREISCAQPGCPNTRTQGEFVGQFCRPCYEKRLQGMGE